MNKTSGSVAAPVIVSELLAREELTIIVMVGSTGSRIETENTLKTLKSYEMISKKRECPVIVAYRENSPEKPRSSVDAEVQTLILTIAAMFSGSNKELDSSDLRNFINYHKVTSYTPKLSQLDFFSKDIHLGKGQSLVTVASLMDNETSHEITIPTEYQATGFLPDVAKSFISVALPIHACIIAGFFNQVVDRLDNKLKVFDEARSVVIEKSIISDNTKSTDEGLVL